MTATDDDLLRVAAEALGGHFYDTGWRCSCDWTGTASEWPNHAAAAVLEAVLPEVRAGAWDEGLTMGIEAAYSVPFGQTYRLPDNPYRARADEERGAGL